MSITDRIWKGLRYIIKGVPVKHVTAQVVCLSPDSRLAGRKLLVTGGGRGLGYAMAEKFVREGAQVVITGRNEEVLKNASERIGCRYLVSDIKEQHGFDELIIRAADILGGLDSLVNNAGISLHEGSILDVTPEGFDSQVAVNLRGAYLLSQAYIRYVQENSLEKADILFISSERGEYADDLPYGITKNALNCLVRGMARRFASKGIRVNAVAPGVTATDMTGFRKDGNLYAGYNMNERVYLPEEVAEVACFLLSDASRCVSGQVVVCNEGKSVNAHWR